MKKGIILLGLFVFLLTSFAAILTLNSGNLNAQVQQKVLQQKRVIPALRTSVVSVTPQKAVLTQGGDAVVVEATGTNLGVINSAQVMRAGNAVAEIEVTLDKSLLPTTLKASLKASSTAPIASDYQLAVLDSSNAKLLDVPTTVLAIEVVAPVQKAVVAQKPITAIKTAEPVQRQVQTAPITSIVKPAVTSVTPQKAVLLRGGEAVVIEAKGTNLTGVGSVQVTRAGVEAQGIEETLDKSQLPNTLKVSLKASVEAPVANDYQLAVFDAGSQKILDVPTAVLAVEVVAPGTKVYAAPMARKPRQQVTAPQDRIAAARTDVASISPQKAVLIQGGDPVVVEAKGAKLDMVGSARVMRAGAPVPEIEASIDRSQLPTSLKVSIKASSQAQVGTGYQLAIFDTNRRKILDVPSTALAIEVVAPSAQPSNQPSAQLRQQRPTQVSERVRYSGAAPKIETVGPNAVSLIRGQNGMDDLAKTIRITGSMLGGVIGAKVSPEDNRFGTWIPCTILNKSDSELTLKIFARLWARPGSDYKLYLTYECAAGSAAAIDTQNPGRCQVEVPLYSFVVEPTAFIDMDWSTIRDFLNRDALSTLKGSFDTSELGGPEYRNSSHITFGGYKQDIQVSEIGFPAPPMTVPPTPALEYLYLVDSLHTQTAFVTKEGSCINNELQLNVWFESDEKELKGWAAYPMAPFKDPPAPDIEADSGKLTAMLDFYFSDGKISYKIPSINLDFAINADFVLDKHIFNLFIPIWDKKVKPEIRDGFKDTLNAAPSQSFMSNAWIINLQREFPENMRIVLQEVRFDQDKVHFTLTTQYASKGGVILQKR